jgi:hypothetical protein
VIVPQAAASVLIGDNIYELIVGGLGVMEYGMDVQPCRCIWMIVIIELRHE